MELDLGNIEPMAGFSHFNGLMPLLTPIEESTKSTAKVYGFSSFGSHRTVCRSCEASQRKLSI